MLKGIPRDFLQFQQPRYYTYQVVLPAPQCLVPRTLRCCPFFSSVMEATAALDSGVHKLFLPFKMLRRVS